MKKTLFFLFFLTLLRPCFCQTPQWKFPIAFEDASGARDTVFFIWDSSATMYGLDTIWGELPIAIDSNKFNVFVKIDQGYSSKVWAIPQSYPIEQEIWALNYAYPIQISWDTSLFHSLALISPVNCAEMSNDYFFFVGFSICNTFDMFSNDSVIAPTFNWGSQEQFPLFISMNNFGYCCLNGVDENTGIIKEYYLSPNPFTDKLVINNSKNILTNINIYSTDGKLVYTNSDDFQKETEIHLSLELLDNGIYVMEIINDKNRKCFEKIVKINN